MPWACASATCSRRWRFTSCCARWTRSGCQRAARGRGQEEMFASHLHLLELRCEARRAQLLDHARDTALQPLYLRCPGRAQHAQSARPGHPGSRRSSNRRRMTGDGATWVSCRGGGCDARARGLRGIRQPGGLQIGNVDLAALLTRRRFRPRSSLDADASAQYLQ
jgi:hypothetical protein